MAEVAIGTEQQIEELGSGIKATRAIDKRAEEQKKKIALPKIPARTLNDEQWLDYSKPLTSDMWTQIPSMYLYRLKPKIIRQQSNPENKNYIDKLDKVADIRSYIIKNHSWGKYKCEINRYMESGSGEVKFCTVLVDVPEDESPELILDVRELDKNDSSNMGLIGRLKAQGKLDDRGNIPSAAPITQASQTPTMQDMMAMLDRFAGMTERLGNRERDELKRQLEANKDQGLNGAISQLFLEKLKQENPATMAQSLTAVLSVAKEISGPPQAPKDDTKVYDLFSKMLEMQQKHSEAMITVLKETKEKPEPGEKILDSVETAMTIMERLNAISGGGGKRSGWDTGLEYAKELGLPLFNAISQIYTVYKMGKPMDSTIQQQGQPAKPSGKTISGMEAAANAARIAAGQKPAMYTGEPNNTPNPPTEVTPEIVKASEDHQQLMVLLQPAAGPILKFMADGRSGAELALAIIDMYGAPSHVMLANFGEDKILAAVKGIPQFWQNLEVYGEERVKQFLTEFIHYEEYIDETEDEEEQDKGNSKGKNKKK